MSQADADARPFTGFLQEQRRGALHQELSEMLAETVAAVIEHGKVGSVTLTLKIKPAGDHVVQVFDELKCNAPEGDKAASIFYTDDAGNVSRDDPRQLEMPLKPMPVASNSGRST
jgi:hypothetical protein